MQGEYLIFNIIVLSGPLFFGIMRRFYFINRWPYAFFSIVIAATPFIIWDILVTGRHWFFNANYVLNLRLGSLPLEEWLFFFTVPFACLFTWEMIIRYLPGGKIRSGKRLHYLIFILPVAGLTFFYMGKEYTGMVILFLALVLYLDRVLETDLVSKKHFYWYVLITSIFTFIFNGYLTARPVVLYGEAYQLGWRVITIPVEDFGYGFSLIFLCTVIYEALKQKYIVR